MPFSLRLLLYKISCAVHVWKCQTVRKPHTNKLWIRNQNDKSSRGTHFLYNTCMKKRSLNSCGVIIYAFIYFSKSLSLSPLLPFRDQLNREIKGALCMQFLLSCASRISKEYESMVKIKLENVGAIICLEIHALLSCDV